MCLIHGSKQSRTIGDDYSDKSVDNDIEEKDAFDVNPSEGSDQYEHRESCNIDYNRLTTYNEYLVLFKKVEKIK